MIISLFYFLGCLISTIIIICLGISFIESFLFSIFNFIIQWYFYFKDEKRRSVFLFFGHTIFNLIKFVLINTFLFKINIKYYLTSVKFTIYGEQ